MLTNKLIDSSSPYLLQHAHNPVNWYPWGEEALTLAKNEDKPIIVSIGYSACHWCHVMERECFENATLAKIMNEHFVCIKVDREERPDVDQIYMEAVQNMGIRGGWPLNVFLNSEGEPFYGGTYFPPQNWQSILTQVANAYKNNRKEIEDSAASFKVSLNRSELAKYGLIDANSEHTLEDLTKCLASFTRQFDLVNGGMKPVPKFPMPSNYFFLLRIGHATKDRQATDHVIFTLKKMALGGIYDQIGGGFARYSTDERWFLPHFEKMLYDNGQLLSLYCEGFLVSHEPLFKKVVYETIAFVSRELTSAEGGFYSALDADSEGVEGKCYVWKKEEIETLILKDSSRFIDYYNITEEGNWEDGNNILYCNLTPKEYCLQEGLDTEDFGTWLDQCKKTLLAVRNKRIAPGLDDKILASWNGTMLNGIIDAYRTFDEPSFLELAINNAHFLSEKMKSGSGIFHSYKNGVRSVIGFLEDYAFVIKAFINLYEATFNEIWIERAKELTEYTLKQFIDPEEDFLYFTALDAEKLIARKKEIFDNVIPSSNSTMASNLYRLGMFLEDNFYSELSLGMLAKIKNQILSEPGYLSNWGNLLTYCTNTTKEIAICGRDCDAVRASLDKLFYPNRITAGTLKSSDLPLLRDREAQDGKTLIYVCENKTCRLPAESLEARKGVLLEKDFRMIIVRR